MSKDDTVEQDILDSTNIGAADATAGAPSGSVLTYSDSSGTGWASSSGDVTSTITDAGTSLTADTIDYNSTSGGLTFTDNTTVASDKFLISSGGWATADITLANLTGPWKFEFLANGDVKVVFNKDEDDEVELHIEGSKLLELLMSKAHIIIGAEEDDD